MKFHWNSHHFSLQAHILYASVVPRCDFLFSPVLIQLQTNRSKIRHIYRINKKLRLHPRDWLRECNFRPTIHTHVRKRAAERQREVQIVWFRLDWIFSWVFRWTKTHSEMMNLCADSNVRKNNNRLAVWQMNQNEFIPTFVPFSVELQQLDSCAHFNYNRAFLWIKFFHSFFVGCFFLSGQ